MNTAVSVATVAENRYISRGPGALHTIFARSFADVFRLIYDIRRDAQLPAPDGGHPGGIQARQYMQLAHDSPCLQTQHPLHRIKVPVVVDELTAVLDAERRNDQISGDYSAAFQFFIRCIGMRSFSPSSTIAFLSGIPIPRVPAASAHRLLLCSFSPWTLQCVSLPPIIDVPGIAFRLPIPAWQARSAGRLPAQHEHGQFASTGLRTVNIPNGMKSVKLRV